MKMKPSITVKIGTSDSGMSVLSYMLIVVMAAKRYMVSLQIITKSLSSNYNFSGSFPYPIWTGSKISEAMDAAH